MHILHYSVKKPFLQLSCTVWIREGPPWSLLTGCLEAPTPQWLSLRGCRASSALVPVAPLLSCSDPTVGETASHIFPSLLSGVLPFQVCFPTSSICDWGAQLCLWWEMLESVSTVWKQPCLAEGHAPQRALQLPDCQHLTFCTQYALTGDNGEK